MGVFPSKHSPPVGLLRRPVRQERAACRQPNGGRVLSLAEPAPPCRTHPAAGIANHLTASTAFAAAALVGAESGRLPSRIAIRAVWNASPQQICAPRKERAPAYTAEHARPSASYAPRRLRSAFSPDSTASRYRTGIRRRTAAASPKRTAPPSEAVSAAGTASARKQDLFSFYFFLPWLKMVKRRTPLPENGRSCAFLTYKLRLTKMRKGGAILCLLKNRSAVVPAVPFCRCFTMFPVRCRIAGVA